MDALTVGRATWFWITRSFATCPAKQWRSTAQEALAFLYVPIEPTLAFDRSAKDLGALRVCLLADARRQADGIAVNLHVDFGEDLLSKSPVRTATRGQVGPVLPAWPLRSG